MIRASLNVTGTAGSRLQEIARQLANPIALYKDTGRRLATELRKHFGRLEQTQANRLGGRRTGFWADVRSATGNPDAGPLGATVTIAHIAFAQKLYGGTITAKNGRALTIPLHPLAHGRRVSVFEQETGAKVFRTKSKSGVVSRILRAILPGSDKPVAIYLLARSVTQGPEPRALPDRTRLAAAIGEQAEKHLLRVLARREVA